MRKWTRISLFLQLLPITLWGQNPYALYTAGNKEILDIIAQLPARAPQILDIPCISPVQQPNFDRLRISSSYGLRIHPITQKVHRHSGIDIPPSGNDTIYATANGILDTVAYNDLIGLHIKIRHKYGFTTIYGHLKRTFIRSPHQKIHIGDPIGIMGTSGRSTGKHLHYTVQRNGQTLPPLPYCYLFINTRGP